jgi:hypothetical protein
MSLSDGALCWASSGTAAKFLFLQQRRFTSLELVQLRIYPGGQQNIAGLAGWGVSRNDFKIARQEYTLFFHSRGRSYGLSCKFTYLFAN